MVNYFSCFVFSALSILFSFVLPVHGAVHYTSSLTFLVQVYRRDSAQPKLIRKPEKAMSNDHEFRAGGTRFYWPTELYGVSEKIPKPYDCVEWGYLPLYNLCKLALYLRLLRHVHALTSAPQLLRR